MDIAALSSLWSECFLNASDLIILFSGFDRGFLTATVISVMPVIPGRGRCEGERFARR